MADERDKIAQETQDMYQKYYTQTYDPAKAGADAFRRAVSRQLGKATDNRKQQEELTGTYTNKQEVKQRDKVQCLVLSVSAVVVQKD